MTGLSWTYVPPLLPLLGLPFAWRRRHDPATRYACLATIGGLLIFLPYLYQSSRFISAPASLLTVLACAAIGAGAERAWRRLRGSTESPAADPAFAVGAPGDRTSDISAS